MHVDGAFGLWAAASPQYRHLVDGIELADSWACDGHKWLNVPYDSGFAFCAHPDVHRGRDVLHGRLPDRPGSGAAAAPSDSCSSRRAAPAGSRCGPRCSRSGASGVADLVDRCCALAQRFAKQLDAVDGFEVVNDVVLNQVLVRFGDDDARPTVSSTPCSARRHAGSAARHGTACGCMRISVSNWSTTEDDVDRSVDAIVRMAQ